MATVATSLPKLEEVFSDDPVISAKLAHLHYVTDEKKGLTRKRKGKLFEYFDAKG